MAIRAKNNSVYCDGVLEEDIVSLCESIPNLGVLVIARAKIALGAIKFFVELSDETRKKCKFPDNKYEILFPNGSFIRFYKDSVGNTNLIRLPDAPIHILINYGVRDNPMKKFFMGVPVHYEDYKKGTIIEKITPLMVDKGYLFGGKEYAEEYARLVQALELIKDRADTYITISDDDDDFAEDDVE